MLLMLLQLLFVLHLPLLLVQYPCLLTVNFRQISHEFTFGVGMNFISYPLILTPLV
jgi:hypothetical protein